MITNKFDNNRIGDAGLAPAFAVEMFCPSFAQSTARALRQNRDAATVTATVCFSMGASLTASIFLAPLAPPVIAIGTLITVLLGECKADGVVKQLAKEALTGIDTALLVCAASALVAASSVVGLPAAATLAPIVGILTALKLVVQPLSGGNSPSGAAILSMVDTFGAANNTDVTVVKQILSVGITAADNNPNSSLRRSVPVATIKEQSTRTLKKRLSELPATTQDYRPALVSAAQAIIKNNSSGLTQAYAGKAPQPSEWIDSIRYLEAFINSPAVPWSHADALKAISNPANAKSGVLSPTKSNGKIAAIAAIGAVVIVVGIVAVRRML